MLLDERRRRLCKQRCRRLWDKRRQWRLLLEEWVCLLVQWRLLLLEKGR